MKKILATILICLLMLPIVGSFKLEVIEAAGDYEVAYIEDNGSFTTIKTYSSLDSAVNKMHENDDYVVRHKNSQSPSKIIAMNSGLVYSYPYRRGYSTMNIYQGVNSKLEGCGVSTYVAEHYEMTYHSTYYYYESKGYGYVEVTLNGFRGYCDLEYTDLVPTKFIENSIPITLGGNDRTGSNEQAFSVICKQNYYYRNGDDLVFVYHRAWTKISGNKCLEYSSTIGVAPEFMKKDNKYYSNDGINFYSDSSLENLVGTYYNYYQYLPLRSKTNISASIMNEFISKHTDSSSVILDAGDDFVNAQNKYGCNAATILCMAIHESAWGTSNIARGKYNLFGWGAFDDATSNATRYDSIYECIKCQMADNLANYMDVKCSRYFSMSLGNKGGGFVLQYASDPYWAEKIASHYYALDKYAAKSNGGKLVDYEKYNLAIVNTKNSSVKKADSESSATLYKTANKNDYQKNLIVINLATSGSYTKTQTSNPINEEGVVYPITLDKGTLVKYNYDLSIGYIKNSDLIVIDSNGYPTKAPDDISPAITKQIDDTSSNKTMTYIEKFDISKNSANVSGFGLIKSINFDNKNVIKHQIILKNIEDTDISYVFDVDTKDKLLNLGDKYIYQYVYFDGSINLNEIPCGTYLTYLRITNGDKVIDVTLKNTDNNFINAVSKSNDYSYRVVSDPLYSYRLVLTKQSTPIDYSLINKPKTRASLFDLNALEIDDNLNMYIKATSLIHGIDFANADNVEYNVYLVANDQDYTKQKMTTLAGSSGYKLALKTDNDITYISFEGNIEISKLNGKYSMILEIIVKNGNNTYHDIIDMSADSSFTLPSVNANDLTYQVNRTSQRNNLVLSIG